MTTQYEQVITALDARGPAKRGRYQCPAHGGDGYNLSVKQGQDGQALMTGHSCGCTFKEMMQSLDPAGAGLKPQPARAARRRESKPRSLEETAEYVYRDESGEILFRVVRKVDQDGFKTFRQNAYLKDIDDYARTLGTARRVLYNLPQICQAITDGKTIYLVEGEKDAETVMLSGRVATCNPMGADDKKPGSKFTEEMFSSLKGAAEIRILIDNDTAGIAHAKYLFNTLKDSGTPVTAWQSPDCSDITEHLNKGGTFDTLHPLDSSKAPTGWATKIDIIELENPNDAIEEETTPILLTLDDGTGLLIPGELNEIHGEPKSGKTWLAIEAAREHACNGKRTMFIDGESKLYKLKQRLQSLGATREQIDLIGRLRMAAFDPDTIQLMLNWCATYPESLIIIDAMHGSLGSYGEDENKAQDVDNHYYRLLKPLTDAGATVLLLDHTSNKAIANGSAGKGARGSSSKLANISGASYNVTGSGLSRENPNGWMKIFLVAERDGEIGGQGTQIADVRISGGDGLLNFDFTRSTPLVTSQGVERPTYLMARIYEWAISQGEAFEFGSLDLQPNNGDPAPVTGKNKYVRTARQRLLHEGYLLTRTAQNGAVFYRINLEQEGFQE